MSKKCKNTDPAKEESQFHFFLQLPKDIRRVIYLLLTKTPASYVAVSLVCREAAEFCSTISEEKKREFAVRQEGTLGKSTEIYYVLPNGAKHGKYELWYESNSQICEERFYNNGKLEGKWESWYSDGKKKCECFCKNGLREGCYATWHPNGHRAVECFFKNGEKEGTYQQFYPTGQIHHICFFKNGVAEGRGEVFCENGEKLSELVYESERTDIRKTRIVGQYLNSKKKRES